MILDFQIVELDGEGLREIVFLGCNNAYPIHSWIINNVFCGVAPECECVIPHEKLIKLRDTLDIVRGYSRDDEEGKLVDCLVRNFPNIDVVDDIRYFMEIVVYHLYWNLVKATESKDFWGKEYLYRCNWIEETNE